MVGLSAAGLGYLSTQQEDSYPIQFFQKNQMFFGKTELTAAQFNDKYLTACLDKIDKGLERLETKYPGMKRPQLKHGLRGPRYFIEFPISGASVDAFSLILGTEKTI